MNGGRRSIAHRLWLTPKGDDRLDDDDDDDDDEEELTVDDEDWRSFRAKLVMGENPSSSTPSTTSDSSSSSGSSPSPVLADDDWDGIGALFATEDVTPLSTTSASFQTPDSLTPLDPSQWAYESGKVIEQGAVILGGVEQDYGFGLRQQYFHKAAILVLEHADSTFTKGIILNRPTDLTLDDDTNPGVKWRVWFGGDVQGVGSSVQSIVCLHSLQAPRAVEASVPVMKDIQWTSFDSAKKLVRAGVAQTTDFWVFSGYAGWGPGQLMGELDSKSWYMVATDSQTLLQELARLGAGADPRDAGLDTWTLLMNMIGRGKIAESRTGDFDDLMLKEWAREHLLSSATGGGAAVTTTATGGASSSSSSARVELVQDSSSGPLDRLARRVAGRNQDVVPGALIRASSAERSPFLLDNQEYHKSVVLIISDDENLSIGAILNRPASKGLDMKIIDNKTQQSRLLTLPLRYGGPFSIKGSEELLWLHCSKSLREAKVGSPCGPRRDGIWKCAFKDLTSAVSTGIASPEDFMAVSGLCVWNKASDGRLKGIQGELSIGRFELIPSKSVEDVWKSLMKMKVMSPSNLGINLDVANEAWSAGGEDGSEAAGRLLGGFRFPLGGLGEGFDEEDDSLVFQSDVKVASLSDDALRKWVVHFLIGDSTLDGDD